MFYRVQAVTANSIAIVLLLSLMVSFWKDYKLRTTETKIFFAMLVVNLFQCIVEPLTILLDGRMFPGAILLCTVLNSMLYMGNVIFAALWATYAAVRVNQADKEITPAVILKYAPAMITLIGAFINVFVPVFFRITPENIYQRTNLFLLAYAITYIYLIYGTVMAYGFGHRMGEYVFMPALNFLTPVFIASLLQYLFPGISLLWVGAALGINYAYSSLLTEASYVDSLTGTYTRHYLNQSFRSVQSRNKSKNFVAGIMLDIDNFKSINDRYGHIIGDEAISTAGSILRKTVANKGMVFRFAGDEFSILMPVEHDDEIKSVINDIHRALHNYNENSDKDFTLSFSYGYTIYSPGENFRDFVRRMDENMYEDKKKKLLRLTDSNRQQGDFYHVNPDRNCILLVDDDSINREIMKNIFPAQYSVMEAENGLQGLDIIDKYADNLCAILMDLSMPEMDGMELLKIINRRKLTENIPTFLITATEDYSVTREAYDLGVIDVITKPVVPFVIIRRLQSVLELFHARELLQATVEGQEKQLIENAITIDRLHRNTIEALASAIEFRDVESGEHTQRIYDITKHLLSRTEMGEGYTAEEIEDIAIGSIMHDIGKIAIPDVILNKPGKLTAEEFDIVKTHTTKGGNLLAELSKNQTHPSYIYARDIAKHHHERWDGKGYPDGLKGEEISVPAQVVSIADIYDALVSPRVYKPAIPFEKAVEMIKNDQCGQFNPKLLECFLKVEPEMRAWYSKEFDSPYSNPILDDKI